MLFEGILGRRRTSRRSLENALTGDGSVEQEGNSALLKARPSSGGSESGKLQSHAAFLLTQV